VQRVVLRRGREKEGTKGGRVEAHPRCPNQIGRSYVVDSSGKGAVEESSFPSRKNQRREEGRKARRVVSSLRQSKGNGGRNVRIPCRGTKGQAAAHCGRGGEK